jgi:hypothetical protein
LLEGYFVGSEEGLAAGLSVPKDSPWTYQEWWPGMAVETLVGPPAVLDTNVYHLWHPVRATGSGDRIGLRRLMQYELAYQDRAAMRELVAGEDLLEKDLARLMKR